MTSVRLMSAFAHWHNLIRYHEIRYWYAQLTWCFEGILRWYCMDCYICTHLSLMPGLHLPQALCKKFVYNFMYDCAGIVGGYRLHRMCYIVYDNHATFVWIIERLIGTNPYGGCAEIARPPKDARVGIVQC